ncbi:MAG: T9SS type A sorting domain-containing protein [Saprospiraceae bacterium]
MKKANSTKFTNVWGWLFVLAVMVLISTAASAQCTLVCDNLVQLSLDEDCEVEITPPMLLESNSCPNGNLIVQMKINNVWVPAIVTSAQIGQTIQVRVKDLVSGNLCWGYVHVEDKLAPVIVCANISLSCAVTDYSPAYLLDELNITEAYPLVEENCGPFTLTHIDTWHDLPCNGTINGFTDVSAYVVRKWTATDPSGNYSSCTQYLYFFRRHIQSVVFPPNVTVGCENPVTNPSNTGSPYILDFGVQFPLYPNNAFCELNVVYTDQIIVICDGSYKILRTWTAYDWCLPTSQVPPNTNPLTYLQIIKVLDQQGPEFECPEDLTVSTDPNSCCSKANLPDILITDNCSRIGSIQAHIYVHEFYTGQLIDEVLVGGVLTSYPGNNLWIPDTLGNFNITPCLPRGVHTVVYTVTDNCSNTSTCSFNLTVEDGVEPTAICDQYTIASLGPDGMTFIPAATFDDGSYDNCSDVHFKVRRMNSNQCQNNNQFLDEVKFCCSDLGDTILVVFRVYDIPVPNGPVSQEFGEGHYNDCMVLISVQDKLKPTCQSPANTTVSCTNFDPTLWVYGQPIITDNCCIDTLTATANYSQFDTVCNRGTIIRTFRAYDCAGLSSSCTQRVVVNYIQDYFVKFPNDVIVTICDGTGNYGVPTFLGKDCELLATSFEDQIFTVVPDACFKIERTWTIINWCTYNPNLGCVNVPNPNPNPTVNNPANLPGPTISALGTLPPWNPLVIKIDPADPTATNYSVFYTGGQYTTTVNGSLATFTVPPVAQVNCYRYKQIIKIIDGHAPVISNCPASPVTFCDLTPNDPFLWNESYYYDAVTGSHDLCEGPTDLTITASDACSLSNIDIHYLLFLDLNGDGTMETVINSNNLPPANTVYFGNALNPNFQGGTSYAFDERPVLPNQKYRFAIQTTTSGVKKTAHVAWNTTQSPTTYVVPELPYGTHKIKWFVADGCGNEATCEYTFIVKDCKAPTVVCLNGLSVNIMPTQMIQLWATDFLQYSQDNCTPTNQLKYGIRRSGTGTGFPVDGNGNPITNVVFTCADLGTQPVELWAIDAAGNADYCETFLIVQDNNGNCPNSSGPNASVAGALKTEQSVGLEEANVQLDANPPSATPMSGFKLSNSQGNYMFSNMLPLYSSYTVTPTKDDNHLNGVSTYDLVLISRHILGLEPLGSPYKMIAADANKSGSITTFDIVELRKLILGIYQELPNNTSWRFVDKAFVFPNQNNPFQTVFPENKSLASIQTNMLTEDFVAVKIGDMNANALASNVQQSTEDRTTGTLLIDVDDRPVQAGESFDLHFKTAEAAQGYQFTLNLYGLAVTGIEKGDKVDDSNFGVFLPAEASPKESGALTVSIEGAREFTVRFRATKAGKISDLLSVSSRITKAEAYSLSGASQEVALRFNNGGVSTIAGVGFELYQNQPNPFVGRTVIGFHLPAATSATLTVYDESGRLVFTQQGDYAKGYNSIAVERALLNASGLLYYKLETASDMATRKMIVVK